MAAYQLTTMGPIPYPNRDSRGCLASVQQVEVADPHEEGGLMGSLRFCLSWEWDPYLPMQESGVPNRLVGLESLKSGVTVRVWRHIWGHK